MVAEPTCSEGSVRLSDPFPLYVNEDVGASREVVRGILEVCVNGSFLQLCNGSSTDLDLADTVCNSLGYDGQLVIFCQECSLRNGSSHVNCKLSILPKIYVKNLVISCSIYTSYNNNA